MCCRQNISQVFLLLLLLCSASVSMDELEKVIGNLRFRHFPAMTSQAHCPNVNSYVIGARVRTTSNTNESIPGINMVELLCGNRINSVSHPPILQLQENVGEWGEVKECPDGLFATGVVLYLQRVDTVDLVVKRGSFWMPKLRDPLQVYEVSRDQFISGFALRCDVGLEGMDLPLVVFGEPGEVGVEMYCMEQRVLAGVALEEEAVISSTRERWIPSRIQISCHYLTNPAQYCVPDLEWERVRAENVQCATSPPSNTSCNVTHVVGASINRAITNLDKILKAYKPARLDNALNLGYLVWRLLHNSRFRKEWESKHHLERKDYKNVMDGLTFSEYSKTVKKVDFIQYNNLSLEMNTSKNDTGGDVSKIQFELVANQLMGYCSVYKIYFPLIRYNYEKYLLTEIEKIKTRVVFAR